MTSNTKEEETRGKRDFVILRADSCKTDSRILNDLLEELCNNSLNGGILQKIYLPGLDKDDQFQYTVTDSDYIICAFEGDNISVTLTDKVLRSHHIKRKQGLYDHVIPLFCDMTPEEADLLLDKFPDLKILSLYEGVFTQDNDWRRRITKRMKTPSLGMSKPLL